MNAYLIYILELNLYLSLFAATFLLIFKHEPYHRVNRWLILGSLFLSAILPLIHFGSAGQTAMQVVQLEPVLITAKSGLAHTPVGLNTPSLITSIYILGFFISLILFTIEFMRVRKLIQTGKVNESGDSKHLVSSALKSPASFFKTLIWSENVPVESRTWIADHEEVHMRENHSMDLIILRIFQAICWFNPFVYLLRTALEATHEFRADEVVVQKHGDVNEYSKIILSQALDINPNVLIHQFSKSNLLKRRIMMLNKQNTLKPTWIKYLALIPLLAIAVVINACTDDNTEPPATTEADIHDEVKKKLEEMTGEKISNLELTMGDPGIIMVEGTDIYRVAEVMPQYPGGNQAMMEFLGNNIVYPDSCKAEGIQGVVFLSFVIDEEGKVKDLEVLRTPDDRLSKNAMEVVKKMPKWTPGKQDGKPVKVQYNLPISYRLQE